MNMTSARCFIKVAELMSFSKAAEALYISQQAVSLHIKRLEDEYHVSLFERRPALKLTESGRLLLEAATDLINREEELLSQISTLQSSFHGSVSIGLPPNRSAAFALEYIPVFCERFPNMTVSLVEQTSSLLPTAILNNEVDLALILRSPQAAYHDPFYFQTISLAQEDLYLLISDSLLQQFFPDNFEEKKAQFAQGVDLLDVAPIPMFLRPLSSGTHREIVEYLTSHGKKPLIRVQSTTTSALIPLCAKGLGIVYCASSLLHYLNIEHNHHFSWINCFPVKEGYNPRELALIIHKRKQLTRPLQDSIQIIQKIYARTVHKPDNLDLY